MKKQKIHREWVMILARNRCTCGCGGKRWEKRTHKPPLNVYAWGEYVRGTWRTVGYFCEYCFDEEVKPLLINHVSGCGCGVEFVGRNCPLPPFIVESEQEINEAAKQCAA